jgi:hypothetical protein
MAYQQRRKPDFHRYRHSRGFIASHVDETGPNLIREIHVPTVSEVRVVF